ncbi:hypothetical protein CN140_26205 [Sinorhizobium meliloti]|nr:hypothetical protein CN140_26205 [Sinorhizobium meliloti]
MAAGPASGTLLDRRSRIGTSRARRGDSTHCDKQKMKGLIWDCRTDIDAYVTPETLFTEHELRQMLIAQLDGSQAKEALGDDSQGGGRRQ